MPIIEVYLPGEPRTSVMDVAEKYRITVERDDGIACSDMEARTALSMYCVHVIEEKGSKKQKITT